MKAITVIFMFHAHEPLWDLPRRLVRGADDRRVARAVMQESFVRRRLMEGRNVYRDLVGFARALGAPVAIDMTNELLHQIQQHAPGTLGELVRAYQDRVLVPVYTCAHHTHPTLLSSEELLDELRLNQEVLTDVLGIPRPRHAGMFFTECSVEARHVEPVAAAGIEYVVVDLPGRDAGVQVEPPDADVQHRPFLLGGRLVGLPRHFDVSQEIWRPLTVRDPARARYQGFLVGSAPVFYDEYQGGPLAAPRPGAPGADDEYAAVLASAIARAPDGGLIVHVQDLELMDFGEQALAVMAAAWRKMIDAQVAQIRFASPDDVLDAIADLRTLPRVEIWQTSWAPEIRPALRSDGHYPPRHAGAFRGHDADELIFKPWPFAFWEAGRFPTTLYGWLLDRFGYSRMVAAPARVLLEEGYHVERLPPSVRLPLLLRLAKRACNYGWYPAEGMSKRPFLDGYLIATALRLEMRLAATTPPSADGLPAWVLPGLLKVPDLIITPRIEYLEFGLERWREERGGDPLPALVELEHARSQARAAHTELLALADAHASLEERPTAVGWHEFLGRVAEHAKAIFLALDHIQRAWSRADSEFLIEPMYRFLIDAYPPRLPAILAELSARWGYEPTTPRPYPLVAPESPYRAKEAHERDAAVARRDPDDDYALAEDDATDERSDSGTLTLSDPRGRIQER